MRAVPEQCAAGNFGFLRVGYFRVGSGARRLAHRGVRRGDPRRDGHGVES